MELKDWLKSINETKQNILDEDPTEKYPAFIINKCLSGTIDALMFANEMNKHHSLDLKLQYDFLLNSLRKRKRFSPWLRKEKVKDLDAFKHALVIKLICGEVSLINLLFSHIPEFVYR